MENYIRSKENIRTCANKTKEERNETRHACIWPFFIGYALYLYENKQKQKKLVDETFKILKSA